MYSKQRKYYLFKVWFTIYSHLSDCHYLLLIINNLVKYYAVNVLCHAYGVGINSLLQYILIYFYVIKQTICTFKQYFSNKKIIKNT